MEVWIGKDGERLGPYPEAEVREKIRSGSLARDDLGWYEGLADWQPLAVLFADEQPRPPESSAAPVSPAGGRDVMPLTATALTDYAGFWKRVLAYLLDALVLYIPSLLIAYMFNNAAAHLTMQHAVTAAASDPQAVMEAQMAYLRAIWPATLLNFVVVWWYYALLESSAWQATVGKLVLGMRVTDLDGRRLTLGRSLIRYPAMLLSAFIFGIGFLMVAWTRRKQGLHDMIAGTLVLNGRVGEPLGRRDPPSSGSARPGGSFDA